MLLEITPHTTIYIAAPANLASGGPELIHQLGAKLKARHFNVSIFYYNTSQKLHPVHDNYLQYDLPLITQIHQITQDDVLIVPETATHFLDQIQAQKVIWWLSVDNYLKAKGKEEKKRKKISALWRHIPRHFSFSDPDKNRILHLYQSEYARAFLVQHGIEHFASLSDYLRVDFAVSSLQAPSKDDTIAYYPKKGRKFTAKLIQSSKDMAWLPIENMTPPQVKKLLLSCKVYVDFGHHPGKDRIPREAVISDCCIISSRLGAAAFYQDMPIDDQYKFEDVDQNIEPILTMIRECMHHYDQRINDFKHYKSVVQSQEQIFESEIGAIFGRGS